MAEHFDMDSYSRPLTQEEVGTGFGSLPDEILQQILSYLPFPYVIQVRMVCKAWLCACTCAQFFNLWAARSSPSLWILLPHTLTPSFSAFNPISGHCLPLPFLSHSLPYAIAASCNGLLCLLHTSPISTCPPSLSMCNPIAPKSFPLPSPPFIKRFLHLGMTAHYSSPHRFLIIASCTTFLNPSPHAQLFDSLIGSWTLLPPPPPLAHTAHELPRSVQNFVWWNDKFCILSFDRVMIYDIHSSQWGTVNLPKLPRIWNPLYLTLHVIRGRLYLEGNFQIQGDFQRRYPLRVGILELSPTTLEWEEVAFMPKEIARQICKDLHPVHSLYTAYSDADCDHICFSPFPAQDEENLVLYHVGHSKWTSLSVCHKEPDTYSGSPNFKGFTFQPALS